MKKVGHFENCWADYGDVLVKVGLPKLVRYATAPTHGTTSYVQEKVSRLDSGPRHTSVNARFNSGYFVESQAVVIHILRTKKQNSIVLVYAFATAWGTTRTGFGAKLPEPVPKPTRRKNKRDFLRGERFDMVPNSQSCFFLRYSLEQLRCRFIRQILRQQSSSHSEVEHETTQAGNGVGRFRHPIIQG